MKLGHEIGTQTWYEIGTLWAPKWGLFIGFPKARGDVVRINGQDWFEDING